MLTLWITGTGVKVTVSCAAGLVDAAGAGLLTVNDPVPWLCRSDALKATCKEVELARVVGRAEPFHNTTELDSNPVPVILIVAALPGTRYRGEIAVMTGTGLFTSNVAAVELPPPGPGFCTVTWLAELPVRSAAGIVAFTSVALTNVVVSGAPFQKIIEDVTKPEPLTSSKVSPDPASTLAGLTLVMAGTGFEIGGGFVEPVVPPPQPAINPIPRMKISSDIFVDCRSIGPLQEIEAGVLLNLSI